MYEDEYITVTKDSATMLKGISCSDIYINRIAVGDQCQRAAHVNLLLKLLVIMLSDR